MRKLFFFLLLILLFPTLALAQNAAPWEVVLYAEQGAEQRTGGEIVVLTPNGISARYPIPAQVYTSAGDAFGQVVISPDRRYAALAFYPSTAEGAPPVAIVNLQAGTIIYAAAPEGAESYALGSFSPDSTQLAISYIYFTNPDAFETAGGMFTVDAATGAIVATVSVEQLAAVDPQQWVAFAQPGEWKADGVRFLPSCYACEGVWESAWYIWNPQTGAVSHAPGEYFSIFGDVLTASGEMLYTVQNPAYPTGEPMGMLPPANVVEYYANGVPPAPDQRLSASAAVPVVYFDPGNLDLRFARWVNDGRAFFVQGNENAPRGVVVFRDGSQALVDVDPSEEFLAGTPDGFLMQDAQNTVIWYQWADGTYQRIPLEQFQRRVRAVDTPDMGGSVTEPMTVLQAGAQAAPLAQEPLVPPQQQPLPPTPAEQCPGFLPSRLTPGLTARVTPGTPNNVRSFPSLQGERIGEIPGGATFNVISGPQCDPAGIAWWQVEYNGLIGWTAEGQGNEYWLEP